jgi:hypothetical protein
MNDSTESSAQEGEWLVLIHRVPPKPDYLRVKLRRRLAKLGAVPLKNSVYIMPDTEEAQEDLAWLAREIEGEGGEAVVCRSRFISGVNDEEIREMFRDRQREEPEPSTHELVDRVEPGSTWVTRQDIHVDRIGSAWLIRRFIDPEARFRFVPARGYRPRPNELRFDMYDAEYTHEGDRCTFETLLRRFGLKDRALRAVAEVIHDVDLKDEKFARAETRGIAGLLDAIALSTPNDDERLERGGSVFTDLYTFYQKRTR